MNYLSSDTKNLSRSGGGVRAWFGDLASLLLIYAEGGHSETRASKMHLIIPSSC
jgi:hypothetical protein